MNQIKRSKANRYTLVRGKSIKASKERIKKQLEELWSYTQGIAQEELKNPSPTTFQEIDAGLLSIAHNLKEWSY